MFTLVKLYITFQDDNLQQRLTQWILRMVENAEIGHVTQPKPQNGVYRDIDGVNGD